MEKLKVIELFGGIGACSKALDRLKIPYEVVDYVEIDKYACASFNALHGSNFEPQDIRKWDKHIQAEITSTERGEQGMTLKEEHKATPMTNPEVAVAISAFKQAKKAAEEAGCELVGEFEYRGQNITLRLKIG